LINQVKEGSLDLVTAPVICLKISYNLLAVRELSVFFGLTKRPAGLDRHYWIHPRLKSKVPCSFRTGQELIVIESVN
jgi:hypothetical protein